MSTCGDVVIMCAVVGAARALRCMKQVTVLIFGGIEFSILDVETNKAMEGRNAIHVSNLGKKEK